MIKEGVAITATFLVAELPKEIAGLEQGKVYADYASMCLPLKVAKLDNKADNGATTSNKSKNET